MSENQWHTVALTIAIPVLAIVLPLVWVVVSVFKTPGAQDEIGKGLYFENALVRGAARTFAVLGPILMIAVGGYQAFMRPSVANILIALCGISALPLFHWRIRALERERALRK